MGQQYNQEVVAQLYQSLLKHFHPDIGPASDRGYRTVATQIIQKAYRENDIKTLIEFGADLPEFPIWDIDSAASSLTEEQERQLRIHDLFAQIQEHIWIDQKPFLPGSLTHAAIMRARKYRDDGDEEKLTLLLDYLKRPIKIRDKDLIDSDEFQDFHHDGVIFNRERGLPPPTYEESRILFILFTIEDDKDYRYF